MNKWILVFSLLALTGCQTGGYPVPDKAELQKADFGQPPADHESTIKTELNNTLFDPYSIRDLKISKPKKAWYIANKYYGPKHFGYASTVSYNAKNRYGAYAGKKIYTYLLKNDAILTILQYSSINYVD